MQGTSPRVAPETELPTDKKDMPPDMRSEIRIADFNFDINGDGDVDPFEKKVMNAFKAADRDNSGTLTPVEMLEIMRGMAEQHKTNKRLGRTVFGLIALVVLLIAALVGVSISGAMVGGEMIKESKVPDCSDPSIAGYSSKCESGNLVRTGSVESFVGSIFDMPAVPTNQLAYMRDITMYIDMTSDANVGGVVEATFKLAGAYKSSDTKAWLRTVDGHTIELDATAKTGTIKMDGVSFPVLETLSNAQGRRLETAEDAPVGLLKTGKELAQSHLERRRKLQFGGGGFGGALLTTGSFTMMAASGGFRRDRRDRQLQFGGGGFGGALLTTGSFTMMAASGGF